ncbi:MAG TPA: radical SAM protein [Anaerolineaceae bacterium]|nr:radical SAM protein [Anaerolineaceae bacterium]
MTSVQFTPAYINLLQSGELPRRVAQAWESLQACDGCAWHCHANRRGGELGKCRTGELAQVSSYGPHRGEEGPLSGWKGSGTIFFTHCNLACQFCQNYAISQTDDGEAIDPIGLAAIMLELQEYGCHNINLVSPSHVVPQILAAVALAAQAGLRLPLVYNSGGYDSLDMLRLLDGVVDIYMPDMKYADEQVAKKYSGVPDYPQVNRSIVREMHRQVGDLQIIGGLAFRGLLVRHLVLPNHIAGTQEIVRFLAEEISKNTYLNLMDQYYPAFRAHLFPEINQRISIGEYQEAVLLAHQAGLYRLD